VQEWRKNHPGYWRRKITREREPLQDLSIEKREEKQSVDAPSPAAPLQDLFSPQPAVLIGLIAQMIGSPLQDDIVLTARRLQQLGTDILNSPTLNRGEKHDPKTPHLSGGHPKGAGPVQLGRSPAGP